MADASSLPQPADVYRGYTYARMLQILLNQDGGEASHDDGEKQEFKEWILEAVDTVAREVPEIEGRRQLTLNAVSGQNRYYLDFDVAEIVQVIDSSDKTVDVMDWREYQEHRNERAGEDLATTTFVLEEKGTNGRWIVRIIPAPTAAATYTVWYTAHIPNFSADGEEFLPIPAAFHPAVRCYAKAELYARQEDFKAKEDAMRDYELALQRARARYKPLRAVQENIRSTYDTPSAQARNYGRMP